MPHIRLMGLVDLPALNALNDKDREAYGRRGCEGFSKSGLDWSPTPDTDDNKAGSELATDRADDIQAEDVEITGKSFANLVSMSLAASDSTAENIKSNSPYQILIG